jgi:hypothetical protein
MSLINDALKQARKDPPHKVPATVSSFQPAPAEQYSYSDSRRLLTWAGIVLLLVGAICFIGWAITRKGAQAIADQPKSPAVVQTSMAVGGNPSPVAAPQPMATAPANTNISAPSDPPPAPATPVVQPFVLKLQGIDYSPSAPSAILNGKTVRPGDQFREYHVKAIGKDSVTLVGPNNQETKVSL